MKKSDVKLVHKDYIQELKREASMRTRAYRRKINEGKMQQYEANKRYLIIRNLKELMELMERKGITISELTKMLNEQPTTKRIQGNLFHHLNKSKSDDSTTI